MGSSHGGEVALDAALDAPERVARLVLPAPAVSGDPDPEEEGFDAATGGLAGASDAAWGPGTPRRAAGWRSGCGLTGRPGRRDG
jgi:pimeloyl-ACP methyl ester carboxylesterase